MDRRIRAALALLGVVLVTGCASMASHDAKTSEVQAASRSGGLAAGIAQLEKSATTTEQRAALLYNLERGELLRLNKQYSQSTEAFLLADAQVKLWEETATTSPTKLFSMAGAALISERLSAYEGQDYEKVWLTTRLALNRLSSGDYDNARVDIKRTHEREAVIAAFRAVETSNAEAEAKSKGVVASGKELNGYPVETLNDPEVLSLKNGYQNALSHYLAGYLYEILNESGLAAPGYRKAIELRPNTGVLEEGLRGLDYRTSFTHQRRQRMTDVLFIVETNSAPARKPIAFTVPVPINGTVQTLSVSYPVIEASRDAPLTSIMIGDKSVALEKIVDVNVMARRALRDAMPGMVFRGITRAVAKGVVQNQLEKNAGPWGALIGIVASAITEQADDRIWRSLPGQVYIARAYVPPGSHSIKIDGREVSTAVSVDGQYSLVPIRLFEGNFIQSEVVSTGKLLAIAAPELTASSQTPPSPTTTQSRAGSKKTTVLSASAITKGTSVPQSKRSVPLAPPLKPATALPPDESKSPAQTSSPVAKPPNK